MVSVLDYLWLVPALPLLGALCMFLGNRWLDRLPTVVHSVCIATVASSAALAVWMTRALAALPERRFTLRLGTWLPAPMNADWAFLLDPLSAVLLLVVTGIGTLIHVFSIGYMRSAASYARFFGTLNLFIALMLLLVLADNYLLLFAGWEGVGLCSYLLIGFHRHRPEAGLAANKAFLTNRVADAALLVGLAMMLVRVGSVRFDEAAAGMAKLPAAEATVLAVLLLIGAMGKSAQLPLWVWLPDAMAGPTPVSALIHAATMVTAGVYLLCRAYPVFAAAPAIATLTAVLGAATALLAACAALVQTDIKRTLAYSTISQLGYMFMALGTGAYWVAVFHLFTHAFFKALLFLGAGTIIHEMDGEQDLRRMGGLRHRMPLTFGLMVVGALALAGVPGLAGFFSKDEILWRLYSSPVGFRALYAVGLLTALLTAFYMWRLIRLAFLGETRLQPEAWQRVHEAPLVMTVPMLVLASGSLLAGWLSVPRVWTAFGDPFRLFEVWLAPVFPLHSHVADDHATELLLMALSSIVALAGILLAQRSSLAWSLQDGGWRALLRSGWRLDALSNKLFVQGVGQSLSRALARFDGQVVDGSVEGSGTVAKRLSWASFANDRILLDGLVQAVATLIRFASYPVRLVQTGQAQTYALLFLLGVLAALGVSWTR